MHTHIHEYMCEYIHPYIHTVKIEVGSTAATRCEGERVALVQGNERRLGFDSEGRCKTPRDSPSPRESREEWWRARSSVLFCLLSLSLSLSVRRDVSFYVAAPLEGECLLPPTGVPDSFGRGRGGDLAGLVQGGG